MVHLTHDSGWIIHLISLFFLLCSTSEGYLTSSIISPRECGISMGVTVRQPRGSNNDNSNKSSEEENSSSSEGDSRRSSERETKEYHNSSSSSLETGSNSTFHQVPRLINGKESQRGAWPWQVSLQLLHPQFGLISHWCGGVLIFPSWILTAAHCIHNDIFSLRLAALWTAVLGEWNREVDENTEVRIPIENIFVHEHFQNYQHDIALLKLSRAATSSDKGVRSVCLPTGYEKTLPTLCVATGWGKTDPKGPLSATLRQIRVPLHNNTICKAKYGSSIPIQPSHLCGGKLDGNFGACIGDSGGPLQCSLHDGRWYLAGITSFGSGCANPGYPDVYTRLSFYLPWIKQQINAYPNNVPAL